MAGPLSKDALLAALDKPDVATREVAVPELGGTVRVREMTGSLRNRLEATYATIRNGGDGKALDQLTVQMLAACVVDEADRPLLNTTEAKRLLAVRPKAAFRLRDAVIELSATDEQDVEAFAEVFDDAQDDGSTSA